MKIELNDKNSKRLCNFFCDDQIVTLVNDFVDNALIDFIVILENLDNDKFMEYYKRMTADEELSSV